MIDAKELARSGCKYIGTPYSTMDCQKLWEKMLSDCGLKMDLGGSNSWYRYIMEHGWCGTPEECKAEFGCIPQGATLFIREDVSASTPEKFKKDGIGDITHMGDYTAMSGEEMCKIAEEAGVVGASEYNFGDGAIHSSSSRGHVCTSKFQGETIKNGGWNRVGLFTDKISYAGISPEPQPEPPEPEPPEPDPPTEFAKVWSENGKPVNTRKGPGKNYPQSLAGKLPVGTIVEILLRNGEWDEIACYENKVRRVCWIMDEFLIPIEDPETEPDPGLLYTVTIPHLTYSKAEALINQYAGASKKEERG